MGIIQWQSVDKANYLLGVVEDMANVEMDSYLIFVNLLKYFYLIIKKLIDIIIISKQTILTNMLMED